MYTAFEPEKNGILLGEIDFLLDETEFYIFKFLLHFNSSFQDLLTKINGKNDIILIRQPPKPYNCLLKSYSLNLRCKFLSLTGITQI